MHFLYLYYSLFRYCFKIHFLFQQNHKFFIDWSSNDFHYFLIEKESNIFHNNIQLHRHVALHYSSKVKSSTILIPSPLSNSFKTRFSSSLKVRKHLFAQKKHSHSVSCFFHSFKHDYTRNNPRPVCRRPHFNKEKTKTGLR